jgi:hypothetical protein
VELVGARLCALARQNLAEVLGEGTLTILGLAKRDVVIVKLHDRYEGRGQRPGARRSNGASTGSLLT